MGTHGQVVWGKSGDLVNFKIEKNTRVEQIWYSALDELIERLQKLNGSDRINAILDRKKLVLLDHSGNQPKLEDHVSDYKCLFVFVRPSRELPNTHPDTMAPDAYEKGFVDLPELQLPAQPSLGDLSSSQELRKICEYLESRVHRCRTYSLIARDRAEFCRRASDAIELQLQARDAVCALISNLFRKLQQSQQDLQRNIAARGEVFENLLVKFDSDMNRLRCTPLHPSLQTDTRNCLHDCVQDIASYKDGCNEKWQGLGAKLSEFEQDLERVGNEVSNISNSLPTGGVDFDGINDARSASSAVRDELRKFQEEVEGFLRELTTKGPRGALGDAKNMIEVHDRSESALYAKLQKNDGAYRLCEATRQHVQSFMKRHVEQAVSISSEIARLHWRVKMYNATSDELRDYFHDLKVVRFMPEAYRWGLLEVFRRIHYHRKVACVISTAQQTLRKFNLEEEKCRKEWQETLDPYLPPTILDALQQPMVNVKVDTHPISVYDLTYPNFQPPYDTPESTTRYYEDLNVDVPANVPLPPPGLAKLHSAVLERELDALVDRLGEQQHPQQQQRPQQSPTGSLPNTSFSAAAATAAPLHVDPVPEAQSPVMQRLKDENAALRRRLDELEARAAGAPPPLTGVATAEAPPAGGDAGKDARIKELEEALARSESLRAEIEHRAGSAETQALSAVEARSTDRARMEHAQSEALARAIDAEERLNKERTRLEGEMQEVLTRCCHLEECIRLLPGMDGFSMEDASAMAGLHDTVRAVVSRRGPRRKAPPSHPSTGSLDESPK